MSAGAEAPTAVDAGFSGAVGLARREITPPLDVTTRSWGPSVNQFSAGVHRPLTLTAVAFVAGGHEPLVLVAADLGWWRTPEDERHIRQGLLEELGAGEDRVLVHLSHTHAGPSASLTDGDTAGTAYLGAVRAAAAAAAREAVERAEPATLTCATGRSSLAADRDLLHAGRYVVGFNPRRRQTTPCSSAGSPRRAGGCSACSTTTPATRRRSRGRTRSSRPTSSARPAR
jgi:hypothetical protein